MNIITGDLPAAIGLVICAVLIPCGALRLVNAPRLLCLPLNGPLGAYTIAIGLGCLVSVDKGRSMVQVIAWLGYLSAFYLMLAAPAKWITWGATALGSLNSLVWLIEFAIVRSRYAGLTHPNVMASWLVLVGFLGYAELWPLHGLALLTTGSRGAVLGVLVAIAAKLRFKLWWALPLLGLAGIALTLLRPGTALGRFETWQEAVTLFTQRPILGWGAGAYPAVAFHIPGYLHADNAPLTVAAETGIVGLLAWCWLVVAVVRVAARSQSLARLGLIAWAVQQLVDHTLFYPWVGLAVMACLAVIVREESDHALVQD